MFAHAHQWKNVLVLKQAYTVNNVHFDAFHLMLKLKDFKLYMPPPTPPLPPA